MQVAAFSARSPYEIGDKIQVITPAGKNQEGAGMAGYSVKQLLSAREQETRAKSPL